MRITCKLLLITFLSICTTVLYAQNRKEFIKKYKHIAIREMERTGIPASITLAQGILESGCGESNLAKEANNHFGIKCSNWNGDTYHMDDDIADECFRKYKHPEQSWIDHSEFLTSRPRYGSLFELETTDYKGWAKGLKSAGYATNPKYADMLIKIIEEEELQQYDKIIKKPTGEKPIYTEYKEETSANKPTTTVTSANYHKREEIRNGILCIEVKEGDSFEKIASYYGIKLKKLLAYNDKHETSVTNGQIVFLKKKKRKAAKGYEFHRVKQGESLYDISQQYGVKLSDLEKYNYTDGKRGLLEGEKVYLRKSAPLY